MADARISQQSVRTVSAGTPTARVSRLVVRTLSSNGAATARWSHFVVRTLSPYSAPVVSSTFPPLTVAA